MMIVNKKAVFFSCFFLIAIFVSRAFAGPFVSAGGAAATPTKYIVTVKSIEFYNDTIGDYVSFFSGSSQIDLGSGKILPGGTGGIIGEGVSLKPGKYTKIRVKLSRDFTMNGSANNVGPGPLAVCSTGGSGTTTNSGFTVSIANRNGATSDQVFSIPPEVNDVMVAAGLEVINNDIRATATISPFTVLAKSATLPGGVSVKFDVADTLEFLNVGTACYGIVLPPTITITPPDGVPITINAKL